MLHWLERLLKLRRAELGRGALLCAYLFLIISSLTIGKVARDALFLGRFDADRLPYAEIAISLVVGIVVALYIRLARHVGLGGLLAGSLIAFSVTAILFWSGFTFFRSDWLFPTFYVWIGIFGVLAVTQVWTLGNFLLTTREAKRVFGLVGAGGGLGTVFGGGLSRALAQSFGTESLLLAMSTLLAISALLVVSAWGRRSDVALEPDGERVERNTESPRSMLESLELVRSSSHLRSIAALICVASIVTTAVGWQFKAIAQELRGGQEPLAIFLGDFELYTGALALAAQLLLTSRILQQFGVGFALCLLPVLLTVGSAGLLVWGNIYAAMLLRGSDKTLRYSIDMAALQLLFLPVPSAIKVQVKSFTDTVIWRLGDGLAGVALLVFATWWGLTAREIGWVVLVFLGIWFLVAHRARTEYLTSLGEGLKQHRVDHEQTSTPVLDRSTASVLAEKLTSGDTKEILYALSLFDIGYHQTAHPAMRGLIHHPSPEVRTRTLAILREAGDSGVTQEAEALLHDENLAVRTEALAYLTRHTHVDPLELIRQLGDFPEATVRSAIVAFLARPGEAQNLDVARLMLDSMLDHDGVDRQAVRLEAARLIAAEPGLFEAQLSRILDDDDPEIVRHAIEGTARLGRIESSRQLLKCLANPRLKDSASKALNGFGSRLVPVLDESLDDPGLPLAARREIPGLLESLGTSEAQRVLVRNLLQGDTALRFRVIAALNKLQKNDSGTPLDRQLVETVLAAEILGHYRSYQALAALEAKLEPSDPALEAFRESLNQEVERVFRLLGLLYPEHDIHAVHMGIASDAQRLRDNALEFLETMLRPELAALLLPLVDGGFSVSERTKRASELLGQEVTTSEDAVRMLVSSGDPWLKSCAAYVIGTLGLTSLEPELERMLADPDPLLAETARQARARLAADRTQQD